MREDPFASRPVNAVQTDHRALQCKRKQPPVTPLPFAHWAERIAVISLSGVIESSASVTRGFAVADVVHWEPRFPRHRKDPARGRAGPREGLEGASCRRS